MSLEPPAGLDPDCQLFLGDPDRSSLSFTSRIWSPAGAAVLGFGYAMFVNGWYRRPVMSGAHKHLMYTAIGAVLGEGLFRLKSNILGEKDIQYYHYMTLHPEDFQAPERVRFRDYLAPWTPIR